MLSMKSFLNKVFQEKNIEDDFERDNFLLNVKDYKEFAESVINNCNIEEDDYSCTRHGEYSVYSYSIDEYINIMAVFYKDEIIFSELSIVDIYDYDNNAHYYCAYALGMLVLNRLELYDNSIYVFQDGQIIKEEMKQLF